MSVMLGIRWAVERGVSPGCVDPLGSATLQELIDVPAMQALMDSHYELARIPMSIIDIEGRLLVGVGWQDVCVMFHRAHPATCQHCVESDTRLTEGILPGEFRLYRCKNNMWDAATPIMVGDRHVGNIFTGQFFFEDEEPEYDVFRAQAAEYGFCEEDYLAALERVPRLSRRTVQHGMGFFLRLAEMLSKLGYANMKLAGALRERERLTESLRETDRHKTEFMAMLSHELRNPLTPVRNSLYILSRAAPGGEQARRAVSVIDRQTNHLAKLIDDLLDMTRVSRGKVELRRKHLCLNQLVRDVVEDYRSTFTDKGVALLVEDDTGELWVDADETRLSQVVGNLLQNAAKFTERGRTTVSVSRDAATGTAAVRVVDTGIGIAPEVLGRLFQPFVQADTSLDRRRGGLGLGLALARSLAELHGGSLVARSEGEGKGAELELRMPLVQVASASRSEGRPAAELSSRVLIVEDVADAAASLREVLELNRHTVEVACDGEQALEKARLFQPQVILCDIGLPGMDGYAVARAIRADPQMRGVCLVALTGYASSDDQRAATDAGFDLHVAKPPNLDTLERLLKRSRPPRPRA